MSVSKLRPLASVQALTWIVVYGAVFLIAVQTLEVLEANTMIIFLAGIAFAELSDRAVSPFTDWYMAENTEKTE